MTIEALSVYFVVGLVCLIIGGFWRAKTAGRGPIKPFQVLVSPYVEVVRKGWLRKRWTVRIGHHHQLFSNGIPCFEPHITITKSLCLEDLDTEKLKDIVQSVTEGLVKGTVQALVGYFDIGAPLIKGAELLCKVAA